MVSTAQVALPVLSEILGDMRGFWHVRGVVLAGICGCYECDSYQLKIQSEADFSILPFAE